jgi:predicted dehydrogenase
MLALEKGVHVYCEKPLAANLNQARQMAAKADQSNVFTHTAFNMRYYPAAQQAKSILASGALGEIYSFRAYFYHNSYMDPQRPTSWRLQKDISGGGALMDLGIHTIDLARFLLGDVHWVQCHTRTFISSRPKSAGSREMVPVDVDDWALCVLGLENGAQGSIEVTRMSGGITDTSRVQIFGSLGSLEIDFNHPAHALYYDKNRNQTIYGAQELSLSTGQRPLNDIDPPAKLSMGSFIDTHFACIMYFLLSIQGKHQSPLNFAAALKAQEILEAAYLSADRNGETIKLPIE